MRTTGRFEIIGIGEFKTLSIAKEKAFNITLCDKTGQAITREVKEQGKFSTYRYLDVTGQEIAECEVYRRVGSKIVKQLDRTDKVSGFKVIDKTEVFDVLTDSHYILDATETTNANFRNKIGKEKALKFVYKKSSRGDNMSIAYIYLFQNTLIMITSDTTITLSQAINEYSTMRQNKKVMEKATEVKTKTTEVESELMNIL